MKTMNIGLRGKLVIVITLVAALPLVAALSIMLAQWATVRFDTMKRSWQALATTESRGIAVALAKDIAIMQLAMSEPDVVQMLSTPAVALPAERREQLDLEWPTMPLDSSPLREVLDNPIAQRLAVFVRSNPRIREILVTDTVGQLVAASERTSDFYQGDEEWWKQAANGGQGQVVIPPVGYDESSNAYTIDFCMAILDRGRFLGVIKVQVDATQWIESTVLRNRTGDARLMLVAHDGKIIYRHGLVPLAERIADWSDLIRRDPSDVRRTPDGEAQAYCPIELPDKIGDLPTYGPGWFTVIYADYSDMVKPIYRTAIFAGFVVLVLVAAVFLVGVAMVNRVVITRLVRLGDVAKKVASGDLTQRAEIRNPTAIFTNLDELDELDRIFNDMVTRLEAWHVELASASQMKSRFIQIAGHELRTPVAFILALSRLREQCQDLQRLRETLGVIKAKARRLDEIIQAMFKLMPGSAACDAINLEAVDVQALLEEVRRACHPFLEMRHQHLVIDVPVPVPPLQADREKLRDIVENLVMNAVKFTPDNGAVIVSLRREDEGNLCITVRDQGPGISASDMPHLFQPFYSGGAVLEHSSGEAGFMKRGIGLGLAVVKHFTELHGGTVAVFSDGGGSTFIVRIPYERKTV